MVGFTHPSHTHTHTLQPCLNPITLRSDITHSFFLCCARLIQNLLSPDSYATLILQMDLMRAESKVSHVCVANFSSHSPSKQHCIFYTPLNPAIKAISDQLMGHICPPKSSSHHHHHHCPTRSTDQAYDGDPPRGKYANMAGLH